VALAGSAAPKPAAAKPVFKSDKVLKVEKDGASLDFKAESGTKYSVEFMESKMAKECEVKVGGSELWTTKSDKPWAKVTGEFTADAAEVKLTFSTIAKEGTCDPYQVKAIKVMKM
jgi:hypothetical protein